MQDEVSHPNKLSTC